MLRLLQMIVWGLFLGATVAHGYRPWQALVWLIVLWALSAAVVVAADADGLVRQLAAPTTTTPDFQPLVYALDVLVPVIDLGQRGYWQPVGPYDLWFWLAVIAGWTLVTAIAAGMTAAFPPLVTGRYDSKEPVHSPRLPR